MWLLMSIAWYVHGHDGVRNYWTRQWRLIDPHLEPRRFVTGEAGNIIVDAHQVVRDRSDNIVTDQMVQHVYLIQGGLRSWNGHFTNV